MKKKNLTVLLILAILFTVSSVTMAEEITIQLWGHTDTNLQEAYDAIIDNFKAEHPNINVELMPQPPWTEFYTKVLTQGAGGIEGPIVVRGKDYWLPEFASRGLLWDFTDYVERDKAEIDEELFERAATYTYEGRNYGLPWHELYYVMYYNVDMIEEAGLPGPPTTWDEWIEYGKEISRPDEGVYATQLYQTVPGASVTKLDLEQIVRAMSDSPETVMWEGEFEGVYPEYDFMVPEVLEALQFNYDNIHKHEITMPPQLGSSVDYDVISPWKAGHVAWFISGPWMAGNFKAEAPEMNWGSAPIPSNNPNEGSPSIVEGNALFAFGSSLTEEQDPEVMEATWKFLKFATNSESNFEWAQKSNYPPLRESDRNKAPFNTDPMRVTFSEQLEQGPAIYHSFHIGWTELQTLLSEVLIDCFYGYLTPEEAQRELQKTALDFMRDNFGEDYMADYDKL